MYSLEHIKYIKKNKKYKFLVKITQLLIFILFIISWQFLSSKNIINSFIFSSPIRVFKCILKLIGEGNLFNHILITVFETIISFLIGTLLGILIASIMWFNKFFAKVIDPYLTLLNSLPKVALGPILIIWTGAGMKSIVIMALLISVIITIINVYDGFMKTDNNKIKLMKSFNASKWQIYTKLLLPDNLNIIISSLKINVSMSLIGLLPPVGEKLPSNKYCSKY